MSRGFRFETAALIALFVTTLALPAALADAVPPPPTSCPADTHPVTGHAGTGCAPDNCPLGSNGSVCAGGRPCCLMPLCGGREDPACGAGQACERVRICAAPDIIRSAGGSARRYREAVSYVNEDKGCAPGSTQAVVAACIASSAAGSSPKASAPGRRRAACSCDLGATGPSPAAPAAPLALGLLALRRRAKRKLARC